MADTVGIIREGVLVFQDTLAALHGRSRHHLALRTTNNALAAQVLREKGIGWTEEGDYLVLPILPDEQAARVVPGSGGGTPGAGPPGGAAEEPGGHLPGAHRGKGSEPMKLLRMEFFKCRRRKIALICLAFVAVQLAWMGRTLTQMEPRELAQGWMSLLYNLAVIDAVMLPLTISALGQPEL